MTHIFSNNCELNFIDLQYMIFGISLQSKNQTIQHLLHVFLQSIAIQPEQPSEVETR